MITTEFLKANFLYKNGKLIKKSSNIEIGYLSSSGYLDARVNNKLRRIHRLIWVWHGYDLPKYLDHINGIKTDNRIENLRVATKAQNEYNKKKRVDNTSGYRGVVWNNQSNKWRVRLSIQGRLKDFGQFSDIELAGLVATEVRHKYHGCFFK